MTQASNTSSNWWWLPAFCLSASCYAQSYYSPDSTLTSPRLYLSAGIYFPEITTSIRIDSRLGLGTDISLEDDLKLSNNTSVFRGQALFPVSQRSELLIGYTNINRSNGLELEKDFTIRDTVFYAGAKAHIKFDVYHYALGWRYSFLEGPGWKAGLSLGARLIQFKTRFEAGINRNQYYREASIIAPALLFGGHISGYLTPKLLGRYSLEYLRLSVSDIKIHILESGVSLRYFIFENFALGAGYAANDYRVRELPFNDDFQGKVIFSFSGFHSFVSARF